MKTKRKAYEPVLHDETRDPEVSLVHGRRCGEAVDDGRYARAAIVKHEYGWRTLGRYLPPWPREAPAPADVSSARLWAWVRNRLALRAEAAEVTR